jgi:hypothetical protein
MTCSEELAPTPATAASVSQQTVLEIVKRMRLAQGDHEAPRQVRDVIVPTFVLVCSNGLKDTACRRPQVQGCMFPTPK